MKKKSLIILALLLPVQFILVKFLATKPLWVEEWYSLKFYAYVSPIIRYFLGFVPFSLGDFLYTTAGIILILWLIKRIKTRLRQPKKWILEALAVLSIIYGCFHIFWGLNYYRLPLHKALKINHDYSTKELINLTERLINQSNEIHKSLEPNDSSAIVIPYHQNELFEKTIKGYVTLSAQYPELTYRNENIKPSLYSIPLTYMGFNGYLNPITGEAQVNTQIVPYKLPTTASHEIGHQLGFAKENEANFIACLATMNHPDNYFRYSGYTFALRYCMHEVYLRNPDEFKRLKEVIRPGILENYREVEEFWLEHQNPLEPLFQATYNQYLIANNQAEGMKSYSYVVALLVNYFDKERKF